MKSHPFPGVGKNMSGVGNPGDVSARGVGLTGDPGQQGF